MLKTIDENELMEIEGGADSAALIAFGPLAVVVGTLNKSTSGAVGKL